jgi:ABC-type antimicrobial peptide transport system permease subunit
MTFRDFVSVSMGNLLRLKLRAFLTVSGVVIAIAAFVSMLSFGAGNQEYVTKQFNELGLFSTMQVYPKNQSDSSDTSKRAVLDQAALERLSKVPGVRLAYPFDAFGITAKIGDTSIVARAQALPVAAMNTKLFSKFKAGHAYGNDTAHSAIVTDQFLRDIKRTDPDSIVGMQLIISTKVSVIDSGLAHLVGGSREEIRDRIRKIQFDSLFNSNYLQRTVRGEVNAGVQRFLNGFFNAQETVCDTLTVSGVLEERQAHRLRIEPVIVPMGIAQRFSTAGFSGNPTDLIGAMTSGSLFSPSEEAGGKTYPQVTLDLDPYVPYKTVSDSIKAMGYRTFSFAEQFDEIRRFFFYFDLALGVVGLIALATASLGIVNTMVMSILERKREIGVLKSLGADDRDIRFLFLAESGVIGAVGAALGIVVGWIITRAASVVAHFFMRRGGIPEVDMFALPMWLILIAMGVGIGVSLLAGLYPAGRAARVDPVEALRNE